MRLRRQLLLVSLLTLALPWAGCEYIREMEKTLRQGQQAALQATALAVAARLASDPVTLEPIMQMNRSQNAGRALYAHTLENRPIIDGYDDDWRSLGFAYQSFEGDSGEGDSGESDSDRMQVVAGKRGDDLFLFVRVTDPDLTYHSPLQGVSASDHLQLWLQPPTTMGAVFDLYTGAPGEVTVQQHDRQAREHRISGIWQEWQKGYQVELRLPMEWAELQLGLVAVDSAAGGPQQIASFIPQQAHTLQQAPPLASRDPNLDDALAVFVGNNEDTLLRVASSESWILGEAGSRALPQPVYLLEGERLLTRIYRLALGDQNFPPLNNPRVHGQFANVEVSQALAGDNSARWYRVQGQQVVRVAVPVKVGQSPVAAVVAEQTTDTLRAMTDSAFSRLVNYSLIAFAIAGLGLIAYASWLSWRIRRLSKAADSAVDSNGRINRGFPQSRSRDELGDLSRSYKQLLERLQQYNSYLESLASKLSHELRTPLAVVRSSLDNLEHEPLSPEAIRYSDRAKEGVERLSRTLTAMSAASRVEQSIRSAELEPVNLRALLADLTDAYSDVYPKVRWAFSSDCASCTLTGSPELLVQLIDKLADNAADFCPEGETVTITLRESAHKLVLQVSNPGPPLPAHMQGQLFDSLVSIRTNGSTGEHLGLGLYIVRLIADFHGGTVAAANAPDGSGAVFTVALPTGRS